MHAWFEKNHIMKKQLHACENRDLKAYAKPIKGLGTKSHMEQDVNSDNKYPRWMGSYSN